MPSGNDSTLLVLKLIRLVRLLRLPRLMPNFQQRLDLDPSFMRLIGIILSLSLVWHLMAIVYW